MARVFAFEGENNVTLEWMPLDVRRKLDLSGIRLSQATWQALALAERSALVERAVEEVGDVASYRALAIRLGGKVESSVPFDARPWSGEAARDAVVGRARELGIEVRAARWGELDDGARYALFRLSDPKKSEEKLRAAVVELGFGV